MIHMAHSISSILYFAFYLPFFTVTSQIPHLADEYTGEWFCYLATFVITYGFTIITFNSLLIAVMKYVFIVRNEDVRMYGDEKALKLFSIFNQPNKLSEIKNKKIADKTNKTKTITTQVLHQN